MMPLLPRDREKIEPGLLALMLALAHGRERWPLFLYGPTGRGKTCAAVWLCDRVPYSVYTTADRAAQWLLRRDDSIWQTYREAPLLVIDELGLRSCDSDLEYVAVKRLADCREHLPAIWISNHDPRRIAEIYDERIYSRICSGTWYCLEGEDRRFL